MLNNHLHNLLYTFALLLALFFCNNLSGAEYYAIYSGSVWKFKKGFEPASTNSSEWRSFEYDDSRWDSGASPFFYGENLNGTPLNDMQGNYTSIYLRKNFNISNIENIKSFEIRVLSDDGCIVWLNGVEILRFNMPGGEIPYNGVASPPLAEPIPWQSKIIRNASQYLTNGDNIIAIHGFNSSLNESSDFVIDCELIIHEKDVSPYILNISPPENALIKNFQFVEIQFNEDLSGVAPSDLLANGIPAISVTRLTPSKYTFEFAPVNEEKIQLQWNEEHQIQDTDGNPLRVKSWNYFLNPDFTPGVIISEIMADNETTIRDEDGDYSDWIEIANLKEEPINLGGWCLTDDKNTPFKWQFPSITLHPGEFILVFASSKNRTNTDSYLHANFSLNKSGEFIGLFNMYDGYVDEITFPAQYTDISYGRMTDNPTICGFFEKPTPGFKNGTVRNGFSREPIFSIRSCAFNKPFYLELFHPTTNCVIYYTTDGTAPSPGSKIYTTPILITPEQFTVVKAYAIEPDNFPSKITSQVYIPVANDLSLYTSSLPAIIISKMDNYQFSYDEYQQTYTTIFDKGTDIFPQAESNTFPSLFSSTKIKIRGTTSTNQPKNNYAIEWIDEEDNERKIETLGMPADSEWILYAPNNYDTPLIHNAFMYELSNRIGRYAPRFQFVELFISEPNQGLSYANYCGIYLLVEKIKRGQNRVNVEKLEPEHKNEPWITGGYIFKKDWLDREDSVFTAGNQTLHFVYPEGREISKPERTAQKQFLIQYLEDFYNTLCSDYFTNLTNGYAAYIDVDSWIDFHLLNTLAFNVDALSLSSYFYKPRNGKIYCGPIWDFDRSMDSRDDPRDDNPSTWWTDVSYLGHNYFGFIEEPWWSRLFQDPDFWQKYIDRYQHLRNSELSISNIYYLIDALSAQIIDAQPREYQRWGDFTAPRNNSYAFEILHMKEWLSNRVAFLDSNFLPPPILSSENRIVPAGFTIQISYPEDGEIYYTTDGSDPRLHGGEISPFARKLKNNQFVIGKNMKFCARLLNKNKITTIIENQLQIPSPWSSMTLAEFVVIPNTISTNDSDGDTLPDWWECYYGLDYLNPQNNEGAQGDPDNDGFSNFDEYTFNTDPLDEGSPVKIQILKNENQEIFLNFKAIKFKYYSIECSTALNPFEWLKLCDLQPLPTNNLITLPICSTSNKCMFFRITSHH